MSTTNIFIFFYNANFGPHIPKHSFWVSAESLKVTVDSLKEPESRLHGGARFFGCFGVGLGVLEDKFAAKSEPQTAVKTQFFVSFFLDSNQRKDGRSSAMHNVHIGQYLFLATEQGEINTTHPNYDIIQQYRELDLELWKM